MTFGFDPSIILSAKNAPSSDFTDTLQAVAALKTHQLQQQQAQAQLADLVQKHQQEQTLASIYKANAGTPDNLATALMQGGFGSQAYAAQDQGAQMASNQAQHDKLIRDVQEAHRKHVGELFYGTNGEDDYQARKKDLASDPDPMKAIYASVLPEKWDKGVTERLGNLAVPAVERAKLAARPTGSGQVIVADDGTQYVTDKKTGAATTVRDEDGNAIKARPLKRGGVKAAGAGGSGGAGEGLSQQALDDFAAQLHNTGQLPPGLGQGKNASAIKIKIANRAAELFGGTDLGGAKAGYASDSKSLASQQKLADSVEAFENTAGKNLDTFLEQANKVADTGSPLFNAPGRKFQDLVAGNPEMAAFKAARQTAVTEIGKVLSGSMGGGALSDSARHEVQELIGPDASLAQIKAAAEILKKDMANRKVAVDSQIKATRSRMSGKPAPAEEQATGGTQAKLNPGEVMMVDKKGRPHAVAEADAKDAEDHGWKRR